MKNELEEIISKTRHLNIELEEIVSKTPQFNIDMELKKCLIEVDVDDEDIE